MKTLGCEGRALLLSSAFPGDDASRALDMHHCRETQARQYFRTKNQTATHTWSRQFRPAVQLNHGEPRNAALAWLNSHGCLATLKVVRHGLPGGIALEVVRDSDLLRRQFCSE